MMLSDILNSTTLIDMNAMESTPQSSVFPPPPMTSIYDAPSTQLPQQKHPLQISNNNDCCSAQMEPPSKKMRTEDTPFHRISCKARGMSGEHNSETAFIDIPIDAPHGLLLCCSNTECANSGRRFRYCKICAQPVAKRNFPKRHGHGLISSASDLKGVDYNPDFMKASSSSNGSIMSCQPCATTSPQSPPSHMIERPHHRRTVSDSSKNQQLGLPQKTRLDLTINEQAWLTLLDERPDLEDSAAMTNWMEKIITFSSGSSFSVDNDSTTAAAFSRERSMVTPPLIEPMGDVRSVPLKMSGTNNVTDDLEAFAKQDHRASIDSTFFSSIDMSDFFDL